MMASSSWKNCYPKEQQRIFPEFVEEYAGVRTALIQSAFRYDFPLREVNDGIQQLEKLLPKGTAKDISKEEEKRIRMILPGFERPYKTTIEAVAPLINEVALCLPKRRERVQHIGLFGYSRGVGTVRLPRAITFTGALYSLGVPPELIGTGRGLAEAKKKGQLETIEKHYLGIKSALRRAGRFVNKESLSLLAELSPHWQDVLSDVGFIVAYLGEELGAQTAEEEEHAGISWLIVSNIDNVKELGEQFAQAALLRKSLG